MKCFSWLGALGWVTVCAGCDCGTSHLPDDAGDLRDASDADRTDAGPEPDAGLDAGYDAAPPADAGRLECRRLCRSPQTFSSDDVVSLTVAPDVGDDRNVDLGPGVRIGDDVLFAFTAQTCCMETRSRVGGVVRLAGDASDSVALYGPEPSNGSSPDSDPFAMPEGAGFAFGNDVPGTVAVFDPSSLDVHAPIDVVPLALDVRPRIPPAFIAREGGYILLRGPAARFELLDAELRSVEAPAELGLVVRAAALVETCSAIVGLFVTGEGHLYTLAFDQAGVRLTPAPVMVSAAHAPSAQRIHAIWDGAAIVVAGPNMVIELDEMGALTAETPVPDLVAALGTDEGLLSLEARPDTPLGGRNGARVVLRERTSGALLRELGAIDLGWYLSAGGIGLADGRVDVVTTSFVYRNQVRGVSLACE